MTGLMREIFDAGEAKLRQAQLLRVNRAESELIDRYAKEAQADFNMINDWPKFVREMEEQSK